VSVWGWLFVTLNVVICVGCLWSTRWNRNALGDREKWGSPSNWIWIWQLIGVALVISLRVGAWHLIWWFVLGYPVCYMFGRFLMLFGYDPLK
jgi:ABC-type spermidine/putrescine transport system permease subunit I